MNFLAGTDADDRADDVGRRVHVDAEAVAFLVDDVKPVRDRTTVRHVKLSFVRCSSARTTPARGGPGTARRGDRWDQAISSTKPSRSAFFADSHNSRRANNFRTSFGRIGQPASVARRA